MARTLLLADDSITIQRVVELTFADEGIRVVSVGDGDMAIAEINREAPDIVLADIGMPGRNGYEVARHIKGSPKLAHIPVVLLTGAFEPVDHARAVAAGCDGVLAKPFEPQLVIARVRELLERVSRDVGPSEDAADDESVRPPDLVRLDNYFDELDAAFATLPAMPRQPATAGAAAERESMEPAPPQGAPLPPLAEAFAALLATEQHLPVPPPTWPAASKLSAAAQSAASNGGAPSEELIDAVTRRVVARLSENVLRECVSDVVSSIAERLVREEIDRIKSSIT